MSAALMMELRDDGLEGLSGCELPAMDYVQKPNPRATSNNNRPQHGLAAPLKVVIVIVLIRFLVVPVSVRRISLATISYARGKDTTHVCFSRVDSKTDSSTLPLSGVFHGVALG